jgi:hypothetical protein
MSILLPVLAVAFVAFCIWLGVRIYNRRERWAKWMAVGVALLPVLYVAGFGPVGWLVGRQCVTPEIVAWLYRPIVKSAKFGTDSLSSITWWYAEIDDYGASGLHELIVACGYRDMIDGGFLGPQGSAVQ